MSFIGVTNYKLNSTRCPNKHHKDFYKGKSLVQIKIDQLQKSGVDHIYISTDDTNVINTENITYIQRHEKFCNELITPFNEAVQEIYNSIPITDDVNTIFTFTMSPLFARYDDMYKQYQFSGQNQLAVYPSKHFYMDVRKRGVNFTPGPWIQNSQDLDPMYQMPFCGVLATMGDLRKAGYPIPIKFDYFEIKTFETLDIDTQEEFEVGQLLYSWRVKNKTI